MVVGDNLAAHALGVYLFTSRGANRFYRLYNFTKDQLNLQADIDQFILKNTGKMQ